jgi:hypothetical protein
MVENAKGDGYGISGFEQFDMWARQNVNLWNYATMICSINGYDEETRIKMIACALAEQVVKVIDENMKLRWNEKPSCLFDQPTDKEST